MEQKKMTLRVIKKLYPDSQIFLQTYDDWGDRDDRLVVLTDLLETYNGIMSLEVADIMIQDDSVIAAIDVPPEMLEVLTSVF